MDMQVIDGAKLRFHSISTFPVCDNPRIRPFLYLQTPPCFISVVAIAFFIPVCAWVRWGTTTLTFFIGTTPVIHFSFTSRHPPNLFTFKQPKVQKRVANALHTTYRYICQGFQLDEEDTCVCHITFIAPVRITAVYMGPVFSVVTNNRHASAFFVSHVTVSLEWCLSSWTSGSMMYQSLASLILAFTLLHVSGQMTWSTMWTADPKLELLVCPTHVRVPSWLLFTDVILKLFMPPGTTPSGRSSFFTIVVKALDYRVLVNWNGAENCFVLANIKC